MLQHLKTKPKNVSYKKERVIFEEIMNNEKIINNIKTNIHTKNNSILDKLEISETLDRDSEEYLKLRNKIINVDEYSIN